MSRFILMAGGTGGHLFPAMALAQELRRRGHDIQLMTDHRDASYGSDFPASATHIVPSATPSVGNPIRFVSAGVTILGGIAVAFGKFGSIKPDAVIGFGGYPVVPPFVAANLRGIPGIPKAVSIPRPTARIRPSVSSREPAVADRSLEVASPSVRSYILVSGSTAKASIFGQASSDNSCQWS